MKIIYYKLVLFLIFNVSVLQAQKSNFKESFKVNSDVIIDINTRHSDIEIETWNKNEVVIEAFMLVDGVEVSEKMKDDFYKKWNFKAKGNKEKVIITSRSKSNIDIHSFDFDSPDYSAFTNSLVDISLGSLDILDSIDFVMPPMPPMPPMPAFPPLTPFSPVFELPDIERSELFTEFDFEAYKNDKTYIEKWKEENKEALGEDANIKIGENSISIKSKNSNGSLNVNKWTNQKEYRNEKRKMLVERRKKIEKIRKVEKEIRKKALEERKIQLIARNKNRKKILEERKKRIKKRREELKKRIEKRVEIKKLLKNRSKLKIKRFIKIKVPKKAKFNMNVKYGTLSFSKD